MAHDPRESRPWWVALTRELDVADARAGALASGLTVAQLNWRPRAESWSIGQCLEHLCISNEVYVAPIAASLGSSRGDGPVHEITPGWFARWFMRTYIDPATQKKRARAPKRIAPVAPQIDTSILDRFIASNARIREVIARAQAHDVNRVRFVNPFVPLIRFTVGTGLQLLTLHNHRHLLQAERVKLSAGFPAA